MKPEKPNRNCLRYKNRDVVLRFTKLFNLTEKQATDIFQQCLNWLWLCANAAADRRNGTKRVPPKMAIDNSVLIIDEMWHNFLCFTKDYNNFCMKYFGVFIHHSPTTDIFNKHLRKRIDKDILYQRKRREKQYAYTVDILGIKVFKKWYIEYDKKYDSKTIKALRR